MLTFGIYSLGFSGAFHFDDEPSLSGLSEVHDISTAVDYVFGGSTGPTGRPLALATFLLHIDAWPDSPKSFLYVNTLIHSFNGILLYWLMLLLLRLRHPTNVSSQAIALATTAMWLLAPLLASTTLMVVQRMTLLSATFVLAGLITYLYGISVTYSRRQVGLLIMSLGIVGGSLLATLAKENGVLLPAYALVFKYCLLQKTALAKECKIPRAWDITFLYLPLTLFATYLVFTWPSIAYGYLHRDFSPLERALTEADILWRYLGLLIAPRPSSFTPFLDNYPLLSPSQTAWAFVPAIAWVATLIAALFVRQRVAFFSLAILWFLAGHSIESTIIPLELYFEHRNYLPAAGPIMALALCLGHMPQQHRSTILFAMTAYISLTAVVLAQVTSLWGNPRLAGELWLIENRSSIRAAEFLAQQYQKQGDLVTHKKIIEESFANNPNDTGIAIQYALSQCKTMTPATWREIDKKLSAVLTTGTFSNSTTKNLDNLLTAVVNEACPGVKTSDLHALTSYLLHNIHYQRLMVEQHNLHLIQFRLYYIENDAKNALDQLNAAYTADRNLKTLNLMVEFLIKMGRRETAIDLLVQEKLRPFGTYANSARWRQGVDRVAGHVGDR